MGSVVKRDYIKGNWDVEVKYICKFWNTKTLKISIEYKRNSLFELGYSVKMTLFFFFSCRSHIESMFILK